MPGPRVRFAPSPTGFLHVGSARTALFNWFVARQSSDGVFVLRIEDTDEARNREEWVEGIEPTLAWLGIVPDEGPYRQSHYAADHAAGLEALERGGFLYHCDCSPESVAQRKGPDAPPGYDGHCRDLGLPRGPRTVFRFRTPRQGVTVVVDDIRGTVEFANELIDDFVVARPGGSALFALANVVDDRRDRVTHVIRGEEHLPNTPKQVLLWRALDEATGDTLDPPRYAHLPILVNEQRKKLSKRRDPVAVELYRDHGYLPEAFANYLALLGWSPRGDEEKVDLSVCVDQFRLSDVSHSPAFFDVKKLTHLNGEYVRGLTTEEFIRRCQPWVAPDPAGWSPTGHVPPWPPEGFDSTVFAAIAPLVQSRVSVLGEVPAMVDFLFVDEVVIDDGDFAKALVRDAWVPEFLNGAIAAFQDLADWRAEAIHELVIALGDSVSQNLRRAQAPIRCAITGRLVGPPLFESLELLGRERTITRLRAARARLSP